MESQSLSVVRDIIEKGFGNTDLDVIDKLISNDLIEHQFGMNGGKEAVKKAIINLSKAFSNREYRLVNYSITGDMVWVHYTCTGSHSGRLMNFEPTGKSFKMDVFDVCRVQNGQLVEHWGIPDRFALLMQLGILQPTPAKPQ